MFLFFGDVCKEESREVDEGKVVRGEKRSKMISWNKTAIMVRKKKTSHGCLIKDGGGHTLGLFLAPLIPCQIPPPIAPIENAPPKSFKMTYGLNIHITKVSLRPSFPRGGKLSLIHI